MRLVFLLKLSIFSKSLLSFRFPIFFSAIFLYLLFVSISFYFIRFSIHLNFYDATQTHTVTTQLEHTNAAVFFFSCVVVQVHCTYRIFLEIYFRNSPDLFWENFPMHNIHSDRIINVCEWVSFIYHLMYVHVCTLVENRISNNQYSIRVYVRAFLNVTLDYWVLFSKSYVNVNYVGVTNSFLFCVYTCIVHSIYTYNLPPFVFFFFCVLILFLF